MSRRLIFFTLLLLSWTLPGQAKTVESWGGSDYVIFEADPAKIRNDPQAWRDNESFHTPACQFDSKRLVVERDLKEMRAQGQKKLALVLWFTHFLQYQECKGFLVNSAGGRFPARILANLQAFLNAADDAGFEEVQIRFAPMGKNMPVSWTEWNEQEYLENWGVIKSTIAQLLKVKGPRLLFDLSGEGIGRGQSDAYVRRLWRDYTRMFPLKYSYGVSVAMAPGRMTRLLDDLRQSGPLPDQIAVDVYDGAGRKVARAAAEMKAAGINLPILIQETYYDDERTYQDLIASAKANGVTLRAIMQWPLRRGPYKKFTEKETYKYIYVPQ